MENNKYPNTNIMDIYYGTFADKVVTTCFFLLLSLDGVDLIRIVLRINTLSLQTRVIPFCKITKDYRGACISRLYSV